MSKRKSKPTASSNGRNAKHPARRRPPTTSRRREPRELEDVVVALAESGVLAQAARAEIRAQRAAGLPITYQRGNDIVREYPDGRLEVLETLLPAPAYKRPRGVATIRNGNGSRKG